MKKFYRWAKSRIGLCLLLATWLVSTALFLALLPDERVNTGPLTTFSQTMPALLPGETRELDTFELKILYPYATEKEYWRGEAVGLPVRFSIITYLPGGMLINVLLGGVGVLGFFSTLILLFQYLNLLWRWLVKVRFSLRFLFCWSLLTAIALGIVFSIDRGDGRGDFVVDQQMNERTYYYRCMKGWPWTAVVEERIYESQGLQPRMLQSTVEVLYPQLVFNALFWIVCMFLFCLLVRWTWLFMQPLEPQPKLQVTHE